MFSRREDEAQELLEQVEYGLRNLPDWLQLPTSRRTSRILIFNAGPGDARTLKPYPADRSTSRGATCTHAHLDEWAVMGDPRRVMASVEPSIAPGGSCHILTTEVGPESPTAAYWRRCIEGEGKHEPVFISALERPDRTAEWYEGQRRAMPLADFNREYPLTWQQALEAGGERMFRSADVDLAAEYARGFSAHVKGRKYACGVDIGLMQDATVLTVLDVTEAVVHVVYFRYLVKASVGEVQWAIEEVHRYNREPRSSHVEPRPSSGAAAEQTRRALLSLAPPQAPASDERLGNDRPKGSHKPAPPDQECSQHHFSSQTGGHPHRQRMPPRG